MGKLTEGILLSLSTFEWNKLKTISRLGPILLPLPLPLPLLLGLLLLTTQ